MMMKKPVRLIKGDTIGIIAPASSFDKENFQAGIRVMKKLGYKVKYERSIFNSCWSKPGHNKQRGFQINRMFADKSVKAILCAKAGYGSHEIVSFLDQRVIQENPKIFVGYSDITILLLYLQYASNMVVFHGPVVSGEFFQGMHPDTIDSFVRLLGQANAFGRIASRKIKVLNGGTASGSMIGGNLTLILESVGTEYEIQTDGKILFLEEVDESVDDVLNGLNNLKELGKLEHVCGILFGRMTNCFRDEDAFVQSIYPILKNYDFPILYGFPSGHTSDIAQAHFLLPFGTNVCLDAGISSVELEESAVV